MLFILLWENQNVILILSFNKDVQFSLGVNVKILYLPFKIYINYIILNHLYTWSQLCLETNLFVDPCLGGGFR